MIIRVTFDQIIIRHLEVLGNPKSTSIGFKCLGTSITLGRCGRKIKMDNSPGCGPDQCLPRVFSTGHSVLYPLKERHPTFPFQFSAQCQGWLQFKTGKHTPWSQGDLFLKSAVTLSHVAFQTLQVLTGQTNDFDRA